MLWDGKNSRLSPLYDNSSSLCAYVLEKQINGYLGKDKLRWKSLVETKSRSLIRRTGEDDKKPTHLEMLQYIKTNYYNQTKDFVHKIITVVTEENICAILDGYAENELSKNKKSLIKKFLLHKIEDMKIIYLGEGEDNVCSKW